MEAQGLCAPLFGASLRQQPANTQAEQGLLGAILTNARALHAVVEFLQPEHFADALHGRIYREARRRVLAGGVADAVSLRTWFDGDEDAAAVGGNIYLGRLLAATVGILNAKEYGVEVMQCWQRREIIGIVEDLHVRAFGGVDPPAALIAGLVDQVEALHGGAATDHRHVMMDQAMDQAIAGMERAMAASGPAGLSTGMATVDEALGGLEPQTLTVVAGRPGMGKTAIGTQWAVHAARAAKQASGPGVLMVSLEMSAQQLGRRVLGEVSRVPLEAIRKGRVEQADVDRIVLARRELDGLPLTIEDCSGLTIGNIRMKARAAKRRHGLGLIVLDHLHIVRPEDVDVRNGATAAIGKISNGLKQMAKEFGCPVVALAQLNRSLESREDKRPTLSDLRQAGEIEQDADAVAFVYRPEYYLPKGEPERHPGESQEKFSARCSDLQEMRQRLRGKAELIFEKLRDGSPQSVPLLWHGATTHFSEPSA